MGKSAGFKFRVQWNSVLTTLSDKHLTSASVLTLAGHKHRCQDKAAENPLFSHTNQPRGALHGWEWAGQW